ncbi:hypothetical protein GJ496_009625 [Pomphorhynchus laevis]|nr:hypothetical protein GJ496_009625 [Pomphorhynchus laevis]
MEDVLKNPILTLSPLKESLTQYCPEKRFNYVERSCDQPASSDIESMTKPESFVDHHENQRSSHQQNYLSNEILEQKCDKLNLQQHTNYNQQGASKGGKVEKEQANALGIDLKSSKPDAQGRLDEDVNAIRSLVSNLFATHEADFVKTLRVYSLFRLEDLKALKVAKEELLRTVESRESNLTILNFTSGSAPPFCSLGRFMHSRSYVNLGNLVNFDSRIKTLCTIPKISIFAVAYTNARSILNIVAISETWCIATYQIVSCKFLDIKYFDPIVVHEKEAV